MVVLQHGKMGAAQHQPARPRHGRQQRVQIAMRRQLARSGRRRRPSSASGTNSGQACCTTGMCGASVLDGADIGAALHRAFGGDHRDGAFRRRGHRGLRARLDHADHRQRRQRFGQRRQRGGGCGVAGHHQQLDVVRHQRARRLHRIARHGVGALGAVGQPRRVAQIDEDSRSAAAPSGRASRSARPCRNRRCRWARWTFKAAAWRNRRSAARHRYRSAPRSPPPARIHRPCAWWRRPAPVPPPGRNP